MSGNLVVPFTFGAASGNVPASELDTDYSTIANYINVREVAIGLVAARPAFGVAGRYYLATDVNGGTLYVDSGTAWVQAGAGVSVTRNLSASTTPVGTIANTAETVLQSFTVPASTLATAGQRLVARAVFTTAANGNIKTVRLRVGPTTLTGTVVIGGDALALNNVSILLEAEIIRITGVTEHVGAARNSNDLTLYPPAFGYTALGVTLANPFLVEATGQNGTAAINDIIGQYMTVDLVTA